MIELLILFILQKHELTMYAISKGIRDNFAAYTSPSFGAIKPALTRLEKSRFIRSRKAMSEGGKLSGFYSVTNEGLEELKKLIMEDISSNPLQFMSSARIKLSCASYLAKDQRQALFFDIKSRAMSHKATTQAILDNEYNSLSFYQRILLDNVACEYNNLITVIEGLEKDNVG